MMLTIIPASELPRVSVKGIDKLVHFMLFLGFGFLVAGSISNGREIRFYALTLLLTVIYGITVEWLQRFIPGRSVDSLDILFNFLGALAGVSLYAILEKKSKS